MSAKAAKIKEINTVKDEPILRIRKCSEGKSPPIRSPRKLRDGHEPIGTRVEGYDLKVMCLGAKLTRGGLVIVTTEHQLDTL